MAVFQFYLQSGEKRKAGWVGDDSRVTFLVKNSLLQQPVLLSPKLGAKSLHIFMQLL
jgi:hypothetical protein